MDGGNIEGKKNLLNIVIRKLTDSVNELKDDP